MTRKSETRQTTTEPARSLRRPEPRKPADFRFTDWAMI